MEARPPSSGHDEPPPPPMPRYILLVEDDASMARALTRLLHREGYILHTAVNGALALAQLPTHRYAVVLCDMLMPTLDGLAFYARLRQDHPSLAPRVIFMTGTVSARTRACSWSPAASRGCPNPSPPRPSGR